MRSLAAVRVGLFLLPPGSRLLMASIILLSRDSSLGDLILKIIPSFVNITNYGTIA
jgi:hypothetical protein